MWGGGGCSNIIADQCIFASLMYWIICKSNYELFYRISVSTPCTKKKRIFTILHWSFLCDHFTLCLWLELGFFFFFFGKHNCRLKKMTYQWYNQCFYWFKWFLNTNTRFKTHHHNTLLKNTFKRGPKQKQGSTRARAAATWFQPTALERRALTRQDGVRCFKGVRVHARAFSFNKAGKVFFFNKVYSDHDQISQVISSVGNPGPVCKRK